MTFHEILVKELKQIHLKKQEEKRPVKEMSYAEHMNRLSVMNPTPFVQVKQW